jgi:hypothetical protein
MKKDAFLKHSEGKILAFGLFLLALFLLLLAISAYFWPERFNILLSMTASNIGSLLRWILSYS